MAFNTKDWEQLYEGARETFGQERAAIFMRAMEPSLREDLATKADLASVRVELADLRATFEGQLRSQTRWIVGAFVGIGGLTVVLAQL